jgi:hypothetical protein
MSEDNRNILHKDDKIKVRSIDRNECIDISPTLSIARNLGSLIRHPFINLYQLDGRYNEGLISVLIAADISSTFDYMRNIIFPTGEVHIQKKGTISVLKAADLLRCNDADLVVVGANSLLLNRYIRNGFYIIPKWVRLFLPITGHPDDIIKQLDCSARKDISRNIRRMLERGFNYHMTTDPKWFDQFYYDMLKPYALQRFSEQAIVRSHAKVKKTFRKGLGIVVTKNGEPVAGAIAFRHNDTLITPFKGIIHGDEQLARDGASTALYYYTIAMAHSSDCTGIDFSRSRPFLCDGILSYKLKWGMELVNENIGTAAFAIAAPYGREPGKKFLDDHPFIHVTESGLSLYKPL